MAGLKHIFLSIFALRKDWKYFMGMLLFDILFLVCLYAAAAVFDVFFLEYESSLVGSFLGYGLLMVYFIAVCFAYSFFTYCNLSFLIGIWPLPVPFEFSGKKIFSFFLYNLFFGFVLFVILFFLWTFLSAALVAVLKQAIVPVILLFYILFSFLFLQVSHVLFVAKKEIKLQELIKNTFRLFSWKWVGQGVLWNLCGGVLIFIGYIILFTVLSRIGQNITDTATMLQFYAVNIIIFLYLVFAAYCFFFLNRLYIFIRIRQEIEKKKI